MKTKLLLSATTALLLSACVVSDGYSRDDRSYDRHDRAPRVEHHDHSHDEKKICRWKKSKRCWPERMIG